MHKLYKITNTVNGKLYIGITKLSLEERWAQHLRNAQNPKYPIHHAIAKHGESQFVIELVHESADRSIISALEEKTICLFNSRENGYNVALGGYGGNLGPEANARRRKTLQSRSNDELARLAEMQRLRQTGKTKHDDAGRRSQSEKVKGNQFRKGIPHDESAKARISAALIGRKHAQKTKTRMSESAIINGNGKRFDNRRVSCVCCKRTWDIGNFTQHINRNKQNEL